MADLGRGLVGFRDYHEIETDADAMRKIWHNLSIISDLKPHLKPEQNKADMRVYYKQYTNEDNLTGVPLGVFNRLLEKCDKHYDQDTSKFIIHFHVGMKMGRTNIIAPPENCGARFIFNLGHGEIYFMEPSTESTGININELVSKKTKINDIPDSRQIYLPANTYTHLGPRQLCNYTIQVRSPPPQFQPPSISPGDMRPVTNKRFIRINKYHRITVVIDILADMNNDKISQVVNSNLEKMNMRDMTKLANSVTQGKEIDEVHLGPLGKKEKKKIKREMKQGSINKVNETDTGLSNESSKITNVSSDHLLSEEDRIKLMMSGKAPNRKD